MAWFLAALAWTLLIFWGCATPGKDLPSVTLFDQADKLIHAGFFFLFVVFWGIWSEGRVMVWLWVLAGIAYGFGLEYYQMAFVPGRSFDIWDGVADSLGAALGALFLIRRVAHRSA